MMTVQSGLMWMGMTGCTLRMSCVPLCGPVLSLVLFWNGKLVTIGFWQLLGKCGCLVVPIVGRIRRYANLRLCGRNRRLRGGAK